MYEVNVKERKGSCETDLFEKMAKNGDLTSIKITDILGEEVRIIGYAVCNIKTNEKEFEICYYDTKEYGLISSGSSFFKDSVINYYGECEYIRVVEIKTKKGKTYKAVPVLLEEKKQKVEEQNQNEENQELPF